MRILFILLILSSTLNALAETKCRTFVKMRNLSQQLKFDDLKILKSEAEFLINRNSSLATTIESIAQYKIDVNVSDYYGPLDTTEMESNVEVMVTDMRTRKEVYWDEEQSEKPFRTSDFTREKVSQLLSKLMKKDSFKCGEFQSK